jgi:putative membrane protein
VRSSANPRPLLQRTSPETPMSLEAQSLLNEWSPPVALDVVLSLITIIYFRGWLSLRRASPALLSIRPLAAFLTGMFLLWVAIGSPLSAFDDASLTVHMIQHILLMLGIPPLLLLGAPALPLLHGLPQSFVRAVLGPFLRWSSAQSLGRFLTHPLVCWILAAIALISWHVPSAFEFALRSDFWHEVEHICFFITAILFWWPVIQPFPSEARWPRWFIPLYLFLGMFPSSALGAFLVFCDRVLYPSSLKATALFSITPLTDQVIAGGLMWVLGMFVCLIPAVVITLKLLSPHTSLPGAALSNSSLFRSKEYLSSNRSSQL